MRKCATTLETEMTAEESRFLLELMKRENLRGQHLEVGTAAGGMLWQMMQCFPDADRPQFVVVDPLKYFPGQLETVQRNLSDHGLDPSKVDFRAKRSEDALIDCLAKKEAFDFMVIDGSHRIMSVLGDLRWAQLLNVGGIMAFHDYGDTFKGVKFTVDRFLRRNSNYQKIGLAGTLMAIRKIAASTGAEVSTCDWIHASMWYFPLKIEKKLRRAKKQ